MPQRLVGGRLRRRIVGVKVGKAAIFGSEGCGRRAWIRIAGREDSAL